MAGICPERLPRGDTRLVVCAALLLLSWSALGGLRRQPSVRRAPTKCASFVTPASELFVEAGARRTMESDARLGDRRFARPRRLRTVRDYRLVPRVTSWSRRPRSRNVAYVPREAERPCVKDARH